MNTNWNDPNFQGFAHQPRPKRERKPLGTPLGRTLLNLAVTLVFAAVYYYVVLPPINLKSEELYAFALLTCAVYGVCAVLTSGFQGTGAKGYFGFLKKQCAVPLAVAVGLAGGLIDWPFMLVRVFAFFPFYAFGVLFRPQLDTLAAFSAQNRAARLLPAASLAVGYGLYFIRVFCSETILDNSTELFHDVSYAGGDRPEYRIVFYLVGIATTAALVAAFSSGRRLTGLGRHTLAIYLLHLPILALLVQLQLFEPLRGAPVALPVLWYTLLAAAALAVLNWQPVQNLFDFAANCWYKRGKS